MTILFEASNPMQMRPWRYRSNTMIRVGWLWFAVAWSPLPLQEIMKLPFVKASGGVRNE